MKAPKLKPGYSYASIRANAKTLYDAGYSNGSSWAAAYAYARQLYRAKFPAAGLFPDTLVKASDRTTKRRYSHYGQDGHLIRECTAEEYRDRRDREWPRANPVRPLPISKSERDDLRDAVASDFSGVGPDVRAAAELFADFTGHEPQLQKLSVPDAPAVLMNFGICDEIRYSTTRDGVAEKYRHTFKKAARPFVCVTPDGEQIYLLGGKFKFTERGIEDKS